MRGGGGLEGEIVREGWGKEGGGGRVGVCGQIPVPTCMFPSLLVTQATHC